jgi:heme-degrading monooxygenase HmoA
MPATPWLALAAVEPDREYLVQLSYLPLARLRKLPAFFRYVQAIRGQLARSEGVLGYSLQAQVLRLEFWTLSAWRDRSALNAFVRADPHRKAMSALQGHMGPTRFIEWRARGAELPPRWADAMGRFQA